MMNEGKADHISNVETGNMKTLVSQHLKVGKKQYNYRVGTHRISKQTMGIPGKPGFFIL